MAGEFSTEYGSNYLKYAGASGAYIQIGDGTNVVKVLSYGITLNDVPFSGGGGGATGLQGVTGPAGAPQGVTGVQGVTGPAGGGSGDGATGLQGVTGAQGVTGPAGGGSGDGATGLQGVTGLQGATGIGLAGIQGNTGIQGVTGPAGGGSGLTGLQGITGLKGLQGLTGVAGLTGADGVQGITGAAGAQGTTGAGGLTGVTYGATGIQGVTGPAGTGGGAGTGTINKVAKWSTTSTLGDSIITDQGTYIQVDGYARFVAAGPNIPFRVYPSSDTASSLFDFYEGADIANSAGINLGFSNGNGWAYDKRAAILKSTYNGTANPAPLGIVAGEPNGAPSVWFLPDNKTTLFGGFTGPSGVTQGVQALQGLYANHAIISGALLGSNGVTGASTHVLTKQADGTQIWSAPSGGGGYTVVPVSAAGYTATQTSGTIILACDSTSNNNTIYLPTASGNATTFIAKKKVGANSVIVDGFNSETLDGYTTSTLTALNESKTFVSDGTNWLVL